MDSRLRKVEHIVVFDMNGEMVAGKKEDPFWFKYQKEYFLGNKKLTEINYNSSRSTKVGMSATQLEELKKRVDKMLTQPFCWVDVEDNPEWVDVNVRGGSTISYMGDHKEKFLQKVLGTNKRVD